MLNFDSCGGVFWDTSVVVDVLPQDCGLHLRNMARLETSLSAEEGSYFWTPLHHCGNHFAFAMEQIKNLVPFGLSTISLPFLPPPIAGFSHIVTNTRSGRQLEVYHRQNIYIWPTRTNLIHWARGMRRSWRATITITNKTKLPDLGETYVPTQTALHWPC